MDTQQMHNIRQNRTGGVREAVPSEDKEHYNSLDGLRALACIGIVLMHVKSNIAVKPTVSFLTENVIGFTGNFVLLFMMVSAFSMCCGYYKRFCNGTITPQQFYSKRYMRVLPLFALLVLVDIAITLLGERAFTDDMMQELAEGFADLTLVFGLLPNADIKVVGVGWFLGLIFVFYMLFPFFVYLLDTKRKAWTMLILSAIMYFVSHQYLGGIGSNNIIFCAPYFIAGGIVYMYRRLIVDVLHSSILYWGYAIITIAYTVFFFVFGELRLQLFSNLLLYSLWLIYAVGTGNRNTLFSTKIASFMSGISMEVYLCHMMFFRIIEKLHLETKIADCDLNYWITCILVLSCAMCFAMIWKKHEKNITTVVFSHI